MRFKFSNRIERLPTYLFSELDRKRNSLRNKGIDVIDLSIGDPDLPTPAIVVNKLAEEARNPEHHRYPPYAGSARFRRAVSLWYEDRFGVSVDPETEVVGLIGSKEGIAHFPLAFLNPGDVALVPDPGYPVYQAAVLFAGGEPVPMPLSPQNGFRLDIASIPATVADRARMLFANYPNNPTGAIAGPHDFEEIVAFARKRNLIIVHDAAYTEVAMGGYEPPSFLQTRGAKEVGIEFHSLSKTFNMTGWRVGFAVGNREAIAGLGKIKTNVDSGVFGGIAEGAIVAFENWKSLRDANNRIYEHRRDLVAEKLRGMKIEFDLPKATFYFWCRVPGKESSTVFCARVLEESGVCLTPGVGFGKQGEGFFRISITASETRLQEALTRFSRLSKV